MSGKVNWIKILGAASSILGLLLPLVDNYVNTENTRKMIQEEVKKALSEQKHF